MKTKSKNSKSKKKSVKKVAKSKKPILKKEMTFAEIMHKSQDAARKLAEKGMFCGGCPMAMMETLEQGALAHGLSEKELDNLLKELNK